MKTAGSGLGTIVFRFSMMVILILILITNFLDYVDSNSKQLELTSIQQTKRVIDSALLVVFSSLAIKGEMNRLNELVGANPFEFMDEFELVIPAYQGVFELVNEGQSGWFYSTQDKVVLYQSDYAENNQQYTVVLDYADVNQSGLFEAEADQFRRLYLKRLSPP